MCPTTVQLHVVEELLDIFGLDNFVDTQLGPDEASQDTAMAISVSAVTGGVSAKSFQLRVWLQGHEVLMLVDSGSSNSFVNEQLARQLSGVQTLPKPSRVRVADGGELLYKEVATQCAWYAQGNEFYTDLKVDWLEEHIPMLVDWRAHFIEIPTPAGPLRLVGHDASSTSCQTINSLQLQNLCSKGSITHAVHLCMVASQPEILEQTPACIQEVLDQFPDVFEEPKGLPPRRACDHRIPLILGARLVNVRQYRYKPKQKTEIEAQVEALLKSGVIQRSNNPFSSPSR